MLRDIPMGLPQGDDIGILGIHVEEIDQVGELEPVVAALLHNKDGIAAGCLPSLHFYAMIYKT